MARAHGEFSSRNGSCFFCVLKTRATVNMLFFFLLFFQNFLTYLRKAHFCVFFGGGGGKNENATTR